MHSLLARSIMLLAATFLTSGCRRPHSQAADQAGGMEKALPVVLRDLTKLGGCPSATIAEYESCNLQGHEFEKIVIKDKAGKPFAGPPYTVELGIYSGLDAEDPREVAPPSDLLKPDVVRFVDYFVPHWPDSGKWLSLAIDQANKAGTLDCPKIIKVDGVTLLITRFLTNAPGIHLTILMTRSSSFNDVLDSKFYEDCPVETYVRHGKTA